MRMPGFIHFKVFGRLGISSMLSALVFLSLTAALVTIGGYSLRTIFKSKYQDVIGLLFADAERLGYQIKFDLAAIFPDSNGIHPTDAVLRLNTDGGFTTMQGGWADRLTRENMNLSSDFFTKAQPKDYILKIAGANYLAAVATVSDRLDRDEFSSIPAAEVTRGSYLKLWKLPDHILRVDKRVRDRGGSRVYVVSREGQLIYCNDESITQSNFSSRPLVRSFFTSPISQGYLSTEDQAGEKIYGAYYELPNSNLVIFAETFQRTALAAIYETIWNSGSIFFIILILAVILLQFPLKNIINPIKDLVQLAESVAKGEFKGRVAERGQGELLFLTRAFNEMCQSLLDRDNSIVLLRKQEVEKIALESEIAMAQNIQNNLLPHQPKIDLGSLHVNATYIPASHCAGDWYNVHHQDGDTLFVIADVSGHGVGASMYTAMIAGIFNLFIRRPRSQWILEEFVAEINSVIFNLGKRQWHVTMIVGIHSEGEIEILNAGHTHPFIRYPAHLEKKGRRLVLSANPLGLEAETTVKSMILPFPSGSLLVLYTDGLTETSDPKGVQWGSRKLSRIIEHHDDRLEVLDEILQGWSLHRNRAVLQDDICVLTLKAA